MSGGWWRWGWCCRCWRRCIQVGVRPAPTQWRRCGMSDPLVLHGVARVYRGDAGELPVLRGADLTVRSGEIVALVAPSGAGKSTLLHVAGLLDRPDGGSVLIEGRAAGG